METDLLPMSLSAASARRWARVLLFALASAALLAFPASRARAEGEAGPKPDPSPFYPRWTALESHLPGGFAASAGLWVLVPGGIHHRFGLASDAGWSLGGVTVALGPGLLRPEFEYESAEHEKGWSVAVQGLIHRTWPWWSPGLPTSTTYVGGHVSAGYLMYRCSLGAMRAVGDRDDAAWKLIGGIGIGLP